MAIGRRVPWSSWQEWLAVCKGLFSKQQSQQHLALQQVAVWRCRGKVPLGIEITACLVEILSKDTCSTQQKVETGSISDDVLRLEYSMAIVRMVNGISDKAQKGRMATSVAHNAAAAGLPRLLVDIRHEASHNDLPSLSLLRLAAAEALQWLHAAYWLRQEAHLQQQQQRVVQLLKDYISLKVMHASLAATSGVLSPGPKRGTPIKQLGAAPSAMAMQLSSSSSKQAAGGKAEEQHAEQAVLNQLKEVPVKAVNALLLVEPLLDHGLLDDCIAQAVPTVSAAATTAGSPEQPDTAGAGACQGILQGLAAQWPALAALLLQGAVQRLSYAQCTAQQAAAMAGWVQLLLTMPTLQAQQATKDKSRGTKRKSMTAEQSPSVTLQHHASFPSAAQVKHCVQALLQQLSTAQQAVGAMMQQVLLMLLSELETRHAAEYSSFGSKAQRLLLLAQPRHATDASTQQQKKVAITQQEGTALAEATQQQAKLLQTLQTKAVPSTSEASTESWGVANDWIPCAIGATPSPFDANGAPPLFQLPGMQTVCCKASSSHRIPATVEQPVSHAGATSDLQHATPVQQAAYINKQQPAANPLAVNSQRIHMLCTHASSYSNIWNAFMDEVELDNEQVKTLRTVPICKPVKVL